MRAYVSGDVHYRESGPRSAECARLMAWLAADVAEVKPDTFVVAGDLYDHRATPSEEGTMQRWLRDLSKAIGGAPIILVGGNHDDPEQIEILGRTAAAGPIIAFTRPGLRVVAGVNICLVPWPRVAHLAAAIPDASIAERREAARAGLADILRGFGPYDRDRPLPSLLVAHANVMGATMDGGQPVASGEEIAVSVGDLMAAEPGAVVLGHIHVAQRMEAPVPTWYTGSLFRTSFGESVGDKGAVLAEWGPAFDGGQGWTLTRRESPARRMLLVSCTWINGPEDGQLDGDEVDPEDAKDAEIRLRVEFPTDEREAARAAAADVRRTLEEAGAFSVTVEERPIVISRTRCSSIATARTTAEKLAEWSKASGLEVPSGASEKLAALEVESVHGI
jgi:DNA repair exonuclease SbcCD nuclease subunit